MAKQAKPPMPPTVPTVQPPAVKPKKPKVVKYLPEETEIYYEGKWIKVGDLPIRKIAAGVATARDLAREEFGKSVVREIITASGNMIPKTRIIELSKETARKFLLKKNVGYGFLFAENIIGRIKGTLRYSITSEAAKRYPDLFEEVKPSKISKAAVEAAEAELKVE